MEHTELESLRKEINQVNLKILELLNLRACLVERVRELKIKHSMEMFSPDREQRMMDEIIAENKGPFPNETIRHLFREIFKASLSLMEQKSQQKLIVGRQMGGHNHVIEVGNMMIGKEKIVIAGPCSVESYEQMDVIAKGLRALGIRLLRGGAFKPRSSPYSFQGLGEQGLKILREVADRYEMKVVTEVLDTRHADMVARYADIMQIGSRNMANYELLKEVARAKKPILLKRGFSATIDEFLLSAEYIALEGNQDIILCERGIRTFARETRFTLDIGAIPLLQQMSKLPVIVDVSHAAGRRDILTPLAKASLSAGAMGVMVEVHPCPSLARSDSEQQLDLAGFEALLSEIQPLLMR